MTASTVASGLTPADRVLLRSVFAWARANGWKRVYPDYDGPDLKDLRSWFWFGPDREVFLEVLTSRWSASGWRFVASETAAEGVEMCADGSLNVQRCADVLVALGMLPPELSSQYRIGANDIFTALTADDPQILADAVAIALTSKAVSE